MRVAIVNDSLMATEHLRRIVSQTADLEVAWVAVDGLEAVQRASLDPPDLILMDLLMPGMDGVESTRRIMSQRPCPILVVTASVNDQAGRVFEALAHGALDALSTPVWRKAGGAPDALELLRRIRMLGALTGRAAPRRATAKAAPATDNRSLVAIGASAGGPGAVARILSALPPHFPAALLVLQHLDPQFQPSLAQWLGEQTPLPVVLAGEGYRPQRGEVALLAGSHHLGLAANGELIRWPVQGQVVHQPSIDLLFESLASHWATRTVGVLLTGMGRDGAVGLRALHLAGAPTIAQNRSSCTVYGMPKAAKLLGGVSWELALETIPDALRKFCQHATAGEQTQG